MLTERDMTIADQILKEIEGRLHFLDSIGLDYVTMSRTAPHALRRRSAAGSAGHADRQRIDRRALRLR